LTPSPSTARVAPRAGRRLDRLSERLGVPRDPYAGRYAVTGLVRALGTGLFYPFSLIYFHRQLDAPLVQIGVCLTVAGLVAAVGVVHTGKLVDRFGARDVMVAATLTRAAVFAVYPLVHHVAVFAVLAAVMTLGYRTDQVAGQVLAGGLAPPGQSAGWLALSRLVLNAGIGAGAMAGGLLLVTPSNGTWLVLANAVAFVAVAAISRTFPAVAGRAAAGRAGAAGDGRVWRDRLFVGVALLNGVWLLVGLAVEIGLPLYLVEYLDAPTVLVGVVVVLNTGLVFLLQLPVGRMIRERPVMRMFGVGVTAYAVTFGILFATRRAGGTAMVAAVLVAVCAFTLGEMLVAVSGMVVVNELAPPGRQGAYVGVSHLFAGLGSAAAPLLFTAGLALSPGGLWLLLAGLGVVLAVVSVRLQGPVDARVGERQAAVPAVPAVPAGSARSSGSAPTATVSTE
jgi:MFS family permease